jgi:hypothetical protein
MSRNGQKRHAHLSNTSRPMITTLLALTIALV